MIAYFNEASLEPYADWGKALESIWKFSNELYRHAQLFRDGDFYLSADFKRRFGTALSNMPPDLRGLVRSMVFTNGLLPCWRPTRVSAADDHFDCIEPQAAMADMTICEATEKKLQDVNLQIALLSAPESRFSDRRELRVTKRATQGTATLRNIDSIIAVRGWISGQHGYYASESTTAPADFQTVLVKDSERFTPTVRYWNVAGKDRRIYKETATNRLFYVDEGHVGHSAHLEVFDANGRHLGEANISTGILEPEKRDPKKWIEL